MRYFLLGFTFSFVATAALTVTLWLVSPLLACIFGAASLANSCLGFWVTRHLLANP